MHQLPILPRSSTAHHPPFLRQWAGFCHLESSGKLSFHGWFSSSSWLSRALIFPRSRGTSSVAVTQTMLQSTSKVFVDGDVAKSNHVCPFNPRMLFRKASGQARSGLAKTMSFCRMALWMSSSCMKAVSSVRQRNRAELACDRLRRLCSADRRPRWSRIVTADYLLQDGASVRIIHRPTSDRPWRNTTSLT
jgi:hypothetical protein